MKSNIKNNTKELTNEINTKALKNTVELSNFLNDNLNDATTIINYIIDASNTVYGYINHETIRSFTNLIHNKKEVDAIENELLNRLSLKRELAPFFNLNGYYECYEKTYIEFSNTYALVGNELLRFICNEYVHPLAKLNYLIPFVCCECINESINEVKELIDYYTTNVMERLDFR